MKKLMAALAPVMLVPAWLCSAEVLSIPPMAAHKIANNPSTYLVDVRSVAEYYLVGHPEMAVNVPFAFWSETEQKFIPNADFIEDIKLRFKPDDVLVFMCRSGHRSLMAAQAAQSAGFTHVFNVKEGFEGETDAKGYRSVGGWKNSGLPYTYAIDAARTYHPAKLKEEVKR